MYSPISPLPELAASEHDNVVNDAGLGTLVHVPVEAAELVDDPELKTVEVPELMMADELLDELDTVGELAAAEDELDEDTAAEELLLTTDELEEGELGMTDELDDTTEDELGTADELLLATAELDAGELELE